MQRQRKYRGYTDLIGHPAGMVYGYGCFTDQSNKHYVISDETGKPDFIQVKEIEDWTGLTDKNGKEIYEGDILTPVNPPSPKNGNRVVDFVDGSFCYEAKESRRTGGWWALNQGKAKLFAVIGNIYENPELLNV